MKASIQFLWTGKGFNKKDIEEYGHGFLIASHVSEKLNYILYASKRHPWHTELMEYFYRHHNEYTILGGGSIVRNKWAIKMYPLTSSAGYIPISYRYCRQEWKNLISPAHSESSHMKTKSKKSSKSFPKIGNCIKRTSNLVSLLPLRKSSKREKKYLGIEEETPVFYIK